MKNPLSRYSLAILTLLSTSSLLTVGAQNMMMNTPSVSTFDQVVVDGLVNVFSVVSNGPGFLVIYTDDGEGSPGAVIGYRQVFDGTNFHVEVPIDVKAATPTLFAVLHRDDNELGVYEFGAVEGADAPVTAGGKAIAEPLAVDVVDVQDQFVSGDTVTIPSVTAQTDGWVVVHADNGEGSFGGVLGATRVAAGTTADVVVELSGEITDVLWPMLHVDTGEVGKYEFGTVDGVDTPVVVSGTIAVVPLWTVPHIRVEDAVIAGETAPTLVARSVLTAVDGFLVVHQEVNGAPGPVAGFAPVSAGLNTDVAVKLDPAMVTSHLWPMLHVDTGEVGKYEFGTVDGADTPVVVDGKVVTFASNASPSLMLEDQAITVAMMGIQPHIFIREALLDAPGWLVIHSSVNGAPGPVIGFSPLPVGLSHNVVVEIDAMAAGNQVFPMLHYDTGKVGEYEFGTVDGADTPVVVDGKVVVAPLAILPGSGM